MVCGLIHGGKQQSKHLFYFTAEEESVCIRKKSVRVSSTSHNLHASFFLTFDGGFHMERTDFGIRSILGT